MSNDPTRTLIELDQTVQQFRTAVIGIILGLGEGCDAAHFAGLHSIVGKALNTVDDTIRDGVVAVLRGEDPIAPPSTPSKKRKRQKPLTPTTTSTPKPPPSKAGWGAKRPVKKIPPGFGGFGAKRPPDCFGSARAPPEEDPPIPPLGR